MSATLRTWWARTAAWELIALAVAGVGVVGYSLAHGYYLAAGVFAVVSAFYAYRGLEIPAQVNAIAQTSAQRRSGQGMLRRLVVDIPLTVLLVLVCAARYARAAWWVGPVFALALMSPRLIDDVRAHDWTRAKIWLGVR